MTSSALLFELKFLTLLSGEFSISLVRRFEKSNATLAGVLNQTKAETKELADDAIRLGSITVKTANEVTMLQIAYARLGFSQAEILALTGPTIDGSIAA